MKANPARENMSKATRIIVSAALLLTLLSGCAGYNLEGTSSLLPPYIYRIGIPPFENETTVPALGDLLTRDIYSEFINRGRYDITNDDLGVDAVLEGTVLSYQLVPRAVDEEGVATSYVVVIVARMEFRDLVEDQILWEQDYYQFSNEYQFSDPTADLITLEMESINLASEDFANKVVAAILTGF